MGNRARLNMYGLMPEITPRTGARIDFTRHLDEVQARRRIGCSPVNFGSAHHLTRHLAEPPRPAVHPAVRRDARLGAVQILGAIDEAIDQHVTMGSPMLHGSPLLRPVSPVRHASPPLLRHVSPVRHGSPPLLHRGSPERLFHHPHHALNVQAPAPQGIRHGSPALLRHASPVRHGSPLRVRPVSPMPGVRHASPLKFMPPPPDHQQISVQAPAPQGVRSTRRGDVQWAHGAGLSQMTPRTGMRNDFMNQLNEVQARRRLGSASVMNVHPAVRHGSPPPVRGMSPLHSSVGLLPQPLHTAAVIAVRHGSPLPIRPMSPMCPTSPDFLEWPEGGGLQQKRRVNPVLLNSPPGVMATRRNSITLQGTIVNKEASNGSAFTAFEKSSTF